jgi:hypothetical protein
MDTPEIVEWICDGMDQVRQGIIADVGLRYRSAYYASHDADLLALLHKPDPFLNTFRHPSR